MYEKDAASKDMAVYQQTRKGRRPIRVHNLLKKAAPATEAIKAVQTTVRGGAATAKGAVSKGTEKVLDNLPKPKPRISSAEVGPLAKSKRASVELTMIEKDPLIQFLKTKHAAEEKPPTSGLVNLEGVLKDNKEEMPRGAAVTEATSMCPCPTAQMEAKVENSWQPYLEQMFDDREGIVRKYKDKDHAVRESEAGLVSKVLGRR